MRRRTQPQGSALTTQGSWSWDDAYPLEETWPELGLVDFGLVRAPTPDSPPRWSPLLGEFAFDGQQWLDEPPPVNTPFLQAQTGTPPCSDSFLWRPRPLA